MSGVAVAVVHTAEERGTVKPYVYIVRQQDVDLSECGACINDRVKIEDRSALGKRHFPEIHGHAGAFKHLAVIVFGGAGKAGIELFLAV